MRCKQYSILIASLIAFSIISADPMPWWEVSYNLDIQYPSMGDYKWEKGCDKLIVKAKAENRRSFYMIDPALGDTVIYLDSSVFNYRGKDISVIR